MQNDVIASMESELDKYNRLKLAISWLIYNNITDSQKSLATMIGYTESTLSLIVNGKQPITNRFLDQIDKLQTPIDTNWISTGVGTMIKGEKEAEKMMKEITPLIEKQQQSVDQLQQHLPEVLASGNVEAIAQYLSILKQETDTLHELVSKMKLSSSSSFSNFHNSPGSGNNQSEVKVINTNGGKGRRGRKPKAASSDIE